MMKHVDFKRVSVIGLGYVGLPTASIIAMQGIDVIGVDINAEIVARINSGSCHIQEPELEAFIQSAVICGRLRAATSPEQADVFVVAVPTPLNHDNRSDLSAVESAFRSIAPVLQRGNLVILESTSPVGTTERMTELLAQLRPDLTFPLRHKGASDILVSYCPERVLPGQAFRELVDNSRTVGGLDRPSTERSIDFYKIFCQGEIVATATRVAELVKLAENSFRDVNIAFANELSMLCEGLNIDVSEVITAANLHPRVKILQPGPGVGGHCIPIDPWFIVEANPERTRLIRTAREVNDSKTNFVYEAILARARSFNRPAIAFLGLTYKPDVDDMRESPAIKIVQRAIHDRIGEIMIVEPNVTELPQELVSGGVQMIAVNEALEKADIIVTLVAHKSFKRISPEKFAGKVVIDPIGLLHRD